MKSSSPENEERAGGLEMAMATAMATRAAWASVLRGVAGRDSALLAAALATDDPLGLESEEPPPQLQLAVRDALAANDDAIVAQLLLLVSKHGVLRCVRELVDERKVDVDAVNERRETALFWAVKGRQYETVEFLLTRGAAVTSLSLDDYTPLSLAVRENSVELVEMLLEAAGDAVDVNVVLPTGESMLHMATRYGFTDVAAVLIAHGADVNLEAPRNPIHPNTLTQAPIARVSDIPTARFLLDNGADISGNTGLLATTFAAVAENPALVQFLLDHGADIRRQRYTELMWPPFTSIVFNQYKTMEITTAHGIDIDAKLTSGMTLLHFCMTLSTWNEVVPYVLSLGADVLATNDRGQNALDLAKIYRPELTELFLKHLQATKPAEKLPPMST